MPGYLHFGFEIVNAQHSGVACNHLLAGSGKRASYKDQLTREAVNMIDSIIIRSFLHQVIYRLADFYGHFRRSIGTGC